MTQPSTPSAESTTVQIPAVSAPELAALVQALIVCEPTAEPRIRGGVARLLAGTVRETRTCGVYRVQGAEGRVYETSSTLCDCPDATRRQRICCHSWAITIYHNMVAIASYERAQARYLLTAKGAAALAACECFCHGTAALCYRCEQLDAARA